MKAGRPRKTQDPLMAICSRCGEEKLKKYFDKSKGRPSGVTTYCKSCLKIIRNERKNNKCIICGSPILNGKYCSKEYQSKKYFMLSNDGTELKQCSKCKKYKPMTSGYYHNDSKHLSGYKSYCKECDKEKRRIWRSTDHAKKLIKLSRIRNAESTKKYRKSHIQQRRKYEATRRRKDVAFALNARMRVLLYHSIRKVKNGRKLQELTGYSIEDLRARLEKQFTNGMTWERFLNGEIHIDHKIPVSAFNYTSPEHIDFKKCWALDNLQPMWAKENQKKHAKLEKPFQPCLVIGIN